MRNLERQFFFEPSSWQAIWVRGWEENLGGVSTGVRWYIAGLWRDTLPESSLFYKVGGGGRRRGLSTVFYVAECGLHIRNKRHKGGQMSSLLFWLFLHWISVTGGRHYLFWPSLFVLAVTICSGRHYLLTAIEWRISHYNNDDICLFYVSYFLYGGLGIEGRSKENWIF